MPTKMGIGTKKKRTWYIDVTLNILISITLSLEAEEIESLSLGKDPRYFKLYFKLWKAHCHHTYCSHCKLQIIGRQNFFNLFMLFIHFYYCCCCYVDC
jgi:hypothetical protein